MNLKLRMPTFMVAATFGLMLLLPAVLVQAAYASSPWHVGGSDSVSSVKLVATNVDISHAPNTIASPVTLYWVGGYDGVRYLTQPELRVLQSAPNDQWHGYFEIYDSVAGTDAENKWSNVVFSPGGSAFLYNYLPGSGNNYQLVQDNNSPYSYDSITFSKYNYGTTFSTIYGVLESYDYTGADFHTMDPIHFTSLYDETTSGSVVYPQMFVYRWDSPPTCITSTTPSSGTVTVSFSC